VRSKACDQSELVRGPVDPFAVVTHFADGLPGPIFMDDSILPERKENVKAESPGRRELAAASAPTFAEITRLAAAATPKIAAMALYIRDHLFDPELSVGQVKDQCRLRDNSAAIYFHRDIGLPPGALITHCRLAVAERLLNETLLPVWKITELVGYSSIQVFSRAYLRHKKERPSALRRRVSQGDLGQPAPLAASPSPDLLQRALAGELEDREVAELLGRLLEIYPPHRRSHLEAGSL
jgi:AraC-like DNA-binding protein